MTSGGPADARRADRVVTIVLLVLGALGALYCSAALQQLPASLATFSEVLGASDVTIPSSLQTLGNTGAITVLAIYAVNLVLSIQLMRARRIAFWVPLAAGAVSFVALFAFTSFAMNQVPELVQLLADPDAISKLFAYIGEQGA